jgi:hypothetical protein
MAAVLILLGVHFADWWAIPDGFGGVAHQGKSVARGIREIWFLTGAVSLFGIWAWKWHKWVGVLIVWAAINTLYGVAWVGRGFLPAYYDLLYLCALSGWFVFARTLRPRKWMFVLLAVAGINVVWAGIQWAGMDPYWNPLRADIPWNRQLTGWMDSNTNLAHFLALCMPLASLISWWLVVLTAIPLLLATKTLPLLGALMGLLVAKRSWKQGFIFLAFAAFYIGLFDPPQFAGDGVRVTVIKDSLWMTSFRPVMGWGAGSFKRIFPEFLVKYPHALGTTTITGTNITGPTLPTNNEMFFHPSNEAVRAVFELGFPVFILMLGWFLWIAGRAIKTKPDKLRDAYAGASVAFLVTMLGYQPLTIPPLAVSGLLVWGLYEGMLNGEERREDESRDEGQAG